ncbi:MAG: hypothetical protein A2V79_07940 [Betaproteobacteria bacterium RBG_16_56_24]|nr:MAG: hypothetical protein A2V79_07940 [Betaproteobacteria bacterium RBG_16_56_24]
MFALDHYGNLVPIQKQHIRAGQVLKYALPYPLVWVRKKAILKSVRIRSNISRQSAFIVEM